jgi:hypothetical protein
MKDSTKRTIRTVLQTALGLTVALPLLAHASGIPQTAPGVGVGLAVAAAVTRIMAVPAVQALLPAWLRTDDTASRQ